MLLADVRDEQQPPTLSISLLRSGYGATADHSRQEVIENEGKDV
jgi:hypothetical protein